MLGINTISTLNRSNTNIITSYRYLRARWKQGYLKDLYHRRVLAGGEPQVHRSSLPNWDYKSELYAFRHRIYGDDKKNEDFIQALTNPSFYQRKDVIEDASFAQPNMEEDISSGEDNSKLVNIGNEYLNLIISGYFRVHFPNVPEEFINELTSKLTSNDLLAEAATSLGLHDLVRTGEFPPTNVSLSNGFKAVIAVLSPNRRQKAIIDIIIPKVTKFALEDILPFKYPLEILADYVKKDKNMTIEPRIIHSSGEMSATPLIVMGIYNNEGQLIGKAPGETMHVALQLAAQDSLLRWWNVSNNCILNFDEEILSKPLDKQPKNHSIYDVCQEKTDLSLMTTEELEADPLDCLSVALNMLDVEKKVGTTKIRHLRHKFSRGSLFKRTFRYLVKPRPYTI